MAHIRVKDVAAIPVAALKRRGSVRTIGQAFQELFGLLMRAQAPLARSAPVGVYYAGEDFDPEDCTFEVCAPLAGEAKPAGFEVKELPAATMVTATHQGSYETIGPLYSEMFEWMGTNGYRLAGPVREVYLVGPGPGGATSPKDYVTEVQLPVTRA